jgi:hypothetical protein
VRIASTSGAKVNGNVEQTRRHTFEYCCGQQHRVVGMRCIEVGQNEHREYPRSL